MPFQVVCKGVVPESVEGRANLYADQEAAEDAVKGLRNAAREAAEGRGEIIAKDFDDGWQVQPFKIQD